MDYMTTLKNSTIVVMLISLLMFFNNYFKNEKDENKKVDIVFGKVNDENYKDDDISDWGQYIIIDD
jgi:hypothetical protein